MKPWKRRSGGHRGRLTGVLLVAVATLGAATAAIGGYTGYVYLTQPAVALQRASQDGPRTTAPGVPTPPALFLPVPVPATAVPSPPAAVQKPSVARHGTWLEIPALAIALPVQEGRMDVPVPFWKALVYPGTAWPGKPGNSYLYAHGIWGEFGGLLWAKVGEPVYVHDYDTRNVATLHISRVVGRTAWNDATWLGVTSAQPLLTMQTCTSYDPHGDLWIVQAR